ncbi:MAG: SpoIIE family protein phosphatase [Blastocatellia bacterium]
MLQQLKFPLLIGIVGYVIFAALFPRMDSSAQWGQTMDRGQAVARAREIAAGLGFIADNTGDSVDMELDQPLYPFLKNNPQSPALRMLTPLRTLVRLQATDNKRSASIRLAPDGRLVSFEQKETTQNKEEDDDDNGNAASATPLQTGAPADKAPEPTAAERALAERALAALPVPADGSWSALNVNPPGTQGRTYARTYATTEERPVKFTAETLIHNGAVQYARLTQVLPPPPFEPQITGWRVVSIILGVLGALTLVFSLITALLHTLLGSARRDMPWIVILSLGVLTQLLLLAANVSGGLFENLWRGMVISANNPALNRAVVLLIFVLLCLMFSVLAVLYWGGALALFSRWGQGRPEGLATVLRGKLFLRPIGIRLAAGILLGGALAAIPPLLALCAPAPRPAMLADNPHRLLSVAWPFLGALTSPWAINSTSLLFILISCGFLAPLIYRFIRHRFLAYALVILAGMLLWGIADFYVMPHAALTITVSLALAVACDQIWRRFDLLTVLCSGAAMEIVWRAGTLSLQPAAGLRAAAWLTLGTLGAALVGALVIAARGREASLTDTAALPRFIPGVDDQIERERLLAEFSVAARAQQQMLPRETPEIPGYEIAAICRPAREVGGDLYDFIPLSDGRLGIVVADVSGKGVPASLYMTLTKGLMISASEELSRNTNGKPVDPGDILREVNRHLYEVCQRKAFVTLFYGLLDPATRVFTYARAGHNPPVWRQTSADAWRMLKPAGLGLGLNAGPSFDRLLKTEQITLAPRDMLFLYSDGITEAMNEQGDEYGEQRLIDTSMRADGLPAGQALNLVLGDVNAHLGPLQPQDDQTLVVVRVTDTQN